MNELKPNTCVGIPTSVLDTEIREVTGIYYQNEFYSNPVASSILVRIINERHSQGVQVGGKSLKLNLEDIPVVSRWEYKGVLYNSKSEAERAKNPIKDQSRDLIISNLDACLVRNPKKVTLTFQF